MNSGTEKRKSNIYDFSHYLFLLFSRIIARVFRCFLFVIFLIFDKVVGREKSLDVQSSETEDFISCGFGLLLKLKRLNNILPQFFMFVEAKDGLCLITRPNRDHSRSLKVSATSSLQLYNGFSEIVKYKLNCPCSRAFQL